MHSFLTLLTITAHNSFYKTTLLFFQNSPIGSKYNIITAVTEVGISEFGWKRTWNENNKCSGRGSGT